MSSERHDSRVLPNYERILYATDGSCSAQQAGKHAVYLAQHSSAQLIVLYVIPNSLTRRISFLLRGAMAEETKVAKQVVAAMIELAQESGVAALPVVETGHFGETIQRAASKFDVDLIVMSSRGGEDLQRIFGTACSGNAPLWAGRPVCVIMC